MTIQHIFYIPTIFLLGFVFGTMTNKVTQSQNNQLLYKTSRRKLLQTFLIFLLVFVVTHIFEIPWGSKAVSKLLGGIEIFDKSPVFFSDTVYERISLFPAEGLMAYKRFTYTIDVLFPFSFLLFLFTYARFVSQRIHIPKYLAKVLIRLSFFWFAFDMLENAVIFNMLSKFPSQNEFLGSSLGFITVIKFGLLMLSILMPSLLFIFANKREINT
jgi:hypothetical protein